MYDPSSAERAAERACTKVHAPALPPTPRPFNEAGRERTSSSRLLPHRSRPIPPFGRHAAAKPVRTAARPVRPAELARRNSRHNRSAAAAPRLPLHNRSSRGWHPAPGIGANRTAGARRSASAWAAGGWDGDGESSRPLRPEEVRLVLSSSVAHYEPAVRPAGRTKPVPPARLPASTAARDPAPTPRPDPPRSTPTRCLPPTSRSRSLAGVRGRLPLQLDGVDAARHARRAQQRPRACRAAAAAAAAWDVEYKPKRGRPARPKWLIGPQANRG